MNPFDTRLKKSSDFLLSHDWKLGYIVQWENIADKGKSLGMLWHGIYLITECGYDGIRQGKLVGDNLFSNMPELSIEGYHYYPNQELKVKIKEVVSSGAVGKIFLIDEIDSMFKARDFKDKEQTDIIASLNQWTKNGNWFQFTNHEGVSVDKIIRDCTQISIRPEYYPESDILYLDIIDGVDKTFPQREIGNISSLFDLYNRRKPIV